MRFNNVTDFLKGYFLWDTYSTVSTFDFYSRVMLPEPNRKRIILERDSLGRIVRSMSPVDMSDLFVVSD